MGWRCCDCQTRHQSGFNCTTGCGHRKCGRCDTLIQGRTAQAQAYKANGKPGSSSTRDQGARSPLPTRECRGCGATNHGEDRCFQLHPELRPPAKVLPICSYCGKQGHQAEACFEANPELRPTSSKQAAAEKRELCSICGKWGHPKETCYRLRPELDPDREAKQLPCPHCGKRGHTEEKCWKRYPERTPGWATDQYEWCRHCQRAGHKSEKCWTLQPDFEIERVKGLRGSLAEGKAGEKCSLCGRWGHGAEDCWRGNGERVPERVKGKLGEGGEAEAEGKDLKEARMPLREFL